MTHGSNQPSFTDNLLKPSNLTMFDMQFHFHCTVATLARSTHNFISGPGPLPQPPRPPRPSPALSGPFRGHDPCLLRAYGGGAAAGASMRGSLSRASLASSGLFTGTLMSRHSRSASLSPTPKSTNHGRWDAGGEWYFLPVLFGAALCKVLLSKAFCFTPCAHSRGRAGSAQPFPRPHDHQAL